MDVGKIARLLAERMREAAGTGFGEALPQIEHTAGGRSIKEFVDGKRPGEAGPPAQRNTEPVEAGAEQVATVEHRAAESAGLTVLRRVEFPPEPAASCAEITSSAGPRRKAVSQTLRVTVRWCPAGGTRTREEAQAR